MDNLSKSICAYYLDHFDELTNERQFHFASRLFLWGVPGPFKDILNNQRPEFTQHEAVEQSLKQSLEVLNNAKAHDPNSVSFLRRPYFVRYPDLRPAIIILFKALLLEKIYGLNAKSAVLNILDNQTLEKLYKDLSNDPEAVAIISTDAINYLYLYQIFFKNKVSFNPEPITKAAEAVYNPLNKLHLKIQLYLYTHCIISEALFYTRQLPKVHLKEHLALFDKLEELIDANFLSVKLDNKFEFLTCAQLLNRTTDLKERIYDEAKQSTSSDGTFIVDTIYNPNSNFSLSGSEHRNVLFIMSNQPFKPKKPKVTN